MSPEFQVDHIADSYVHYTKKALVPFLELALIENLDGDNRGVLYCARVIGLLIRGEYANLKSNTYMSKLSFQYGLRVFFMTLVVCVCSASTVMTANGSGSLNTSRLARPSAATTKK